MAKDNNKPSFIFYIDWWYMLQGQPDDVRLKMYDAIFAYAFEGKEPEEAIIKMAFSLVKGQIDRDMEKYLAKIEKRREAGRAGAAKTNKLRWGTDDDNGQQESAKSANADICQQESAKSAYNVNDKVNVNFNDNNFKSTNVDMSQSPDSDPPQVRYEGLVEFWNKLVADKAMPKITDIKDGTTRRKLVAARIKEYGKDKFAECLRKAAASAFLNGDNDKSFIASFDWIIKPNNFPKVLEGNYSQMHIDNKGGKQITRDHDDW